MSLSLAFALNSFIALPSLAIDAYDEGVKLFQKKSYEQSAKEFEKVLVKDPKNEKAIYYAGLSCQYMGDNKRALEYYKDLIGKFPDSTTSKYLKSTLKLTAATTSLSSKDFIPDSEVVPFVRNSHRDIVVTCRLNNGFLPMIFDTGAEGSLVGKNHLLSLGIAMPTGKPTGASLGFGGMVKSWSVPVEIQLGKIRKTIDIGVHEKSDFALLGQDFFGDMKYNIDHHAGVIRFHKVGAKGGYVPVDTIQVPFTREGKELLINVSLGGFPTQMYFDTGATTTVLGKDVEFFVKMRGWKTNYSGKITGVGGSQTVAVYSIPEIKVGEISHQNLRAVMLSEQTISRGVLGQDFFGHRQFVIDEEKKVIHFYRR